MGRPKKWASDAERKASKRTSPVVNGQIEAVSGQSKRTEDSKRTSIKWEDVPLSHFSGKGRGVVVDGYVMVSLGLEHEERVVSEDTWRGRMSHQCIHDAQHKVGAWSCKPCLLAA